MKAYAIAAVAITAIGLSACSQKATLAPRDEGVCYHVVPGEGGKGAVRFNVVARDQPQIEFCAARLEEMRLRFLRLGGSNSDMVGAYQGQFIFINREGVQFGKTLTGQRFFALTRTGDGRLAIPGAIQRQIDGRPIAVAPN
jgi:hypothetical protein